MGSRRLLGRRALNQAACRSSSDLSSPCEPSGSEFRSRWRLTNTVGTTLLQDNEVISSRVTHNEDMASLGMALVMVLRDHRRAGAQSGDLSLGVDLGDAQHRFTRVSSSPALAEQCDREGPYRSMFPNLERDCDIWEKWKSRSGQ